MTCLSDLLYRIETNPGNRAVAAQVIAEAYTAGVLAARWRNDLIDSAALMRNVVDRGCAGVSREAERGEERVVPEVAK